MKNLNQINTHKV